MANNKARKRPQAQKSTIVRSRSIETRDFLLQGRGGTHKAATDYRRKPKHVNRQEW